MDLHFAWPSESHRLQCKYKYKDIGTEAGLGPATAGSRGGWARGVRIMGQGGKERGKATKLFINLPIKCSSQMNHLAEKITEPVVRVWGLDTAMGGCSAARLWAGAEWAGLGWAGPPTPTLEKKSLSHTLVFHTSLLDWNSLNPQLDGTDNIQI